MDLGLKGKIAIVTGGSIGIGKGIVECLAREGATVVIADINLADAKKVADQVGNGTVAVKMDVTKKADVKGMVKDTLDRYGKIDILVNNAGLSGGRVNFLDIDEDLWDSVQDVNIRGIYLITQAVLPDMMKRKYGKIVNISSLAGKDGIPNQSHYCASKFAVIGLTQSLAKEYGEYNLNINAVCPGAVRTPLWNALLEMLSKQQGRSPDEIFNDFVSSSPFKRPQTPEDIGNLVAFLASDISKNITGQAVNITGGMLMAH